MKKSLIALAALAAVGAASAQSTVTISGAMVLGVGTTKTGSTSTGPEIVRQTGNINFSGTEDLGGGLRARFGLETSIGASGATNSPAHSTINSGTGTSSATTLGDRGAFLAVEGGFGTVLVGRAASGIRANFGAAGDVSRLAVINGLSAGGSTADSSARVIVGDAYSNQVAYQSPTMSGFNVTIGVAPVAGNTSITKDTMSYGVNYAAGPLTVRLNLTDVSNITDTAAANTGYKLTTLNASYDFGVARVGLTHQAYSVDTGTKPGNGNAITANIPMGASSIGLGYGSRSATAAAGTRVGGDDVKQMFVGLRHDLSKRTHVQVVYNKINREGATTTADVKEGHILIGHSF
jgi:predicted porin